MAKALLAANPFVPATREQVKIRMAVYGPSGCGKTWTALLIAEEIARLQGGKIAVIDTEGRSAQKYSHRFTFDVLNLADNYDPDLYIQGIEAAARGKYAVLVIDSLSHAWNGTGGILEIVDSAGKRLGGNTWAGWSEGRPKQNALVQALINTPIHIIGTLRSKIEWVQEVQPNVKTKPVKIGVEAVQSSEFEYEFDFSFMMDMEHQITVSKSRCEEIATNALLTDAAEVAKTAYGWAMLGSAAAITVLKASQSYLGTEAGKKRLSELLKDLGATSKEHYAPYLKALGVGAFGDVTLNENDLHQKLRELHAEFAKKQADKPADEQPATPSESGKSDKQDEPKVGTWANAENLKYLVSLFTNGKSDHYQIEGLTLTEMSTLVDIERPDDYAAWNQKFLDGKKASAGIVAAFEESQKKTPPATPKASKPAETTTQPLAVPPGTPAEVTSRKARYVKVGKAGYTEWECQHEGKVFTVRLYGTTEAFKQFYPEGLLPKEIEAIRSQPDTWMDTGIAYSFAWELSKEGGYATVKPGTFRFQELDF